MILLAAALTLFDGAFLQPNTPAAAALPDVSFIRAATNSVNASASTTASIQVDGSNRCLVVLIGGADANPITVSSVVFNGAENFTHVTNTTIFGGVIYQGIYRLANPTATTANVVATYSEALDDVGMLVLLLNNVDQSSPVQDFDAVASESAVASRTLTLDSTAGDMLVDGLGWYADASTYTPGAGQTQRGVADPGSDVAATRASTESATTTSTVMSWTISPSDIAIQVAATFNKSP